MNPQTESGQPAVADLSTAVVEVVGNGRMGRALVMQLRDAGVHVVGPSGRGADGARATVVLLCVPDREIAQASATIRPGRVVGHVSASAPLSLLAPHERFVMHPLLTVTGESARFHGAVSATEGSTSRALALASAIAERLGMRPREIPASSRALYHAMASMASNYLITVLGAAEELALSMGLERNDLEPLVHASVDNWIKLGARAALTGPVVRRDEVTVTRQREAIDVATPQLLPLWDALTQGTRDLARSHSVKTG